MTSSRSGLFCAAFDCSNNKSVQKVRDLDLPFSERTICGCL